MNKTLFHLCERNIKLMLVILKLSLIKKLQTNSMQKQFPPLLTLFRNEGLAHLSYKVITFLDFQTILSVIDFQQEQCETQSASNIQKLSQNHPSQNFIHRMLQSYYFLRQYLNKTDRSMYYSFYQEPQFIDQQITLTSSLIINQSIANTSNQALSTFYRKINAILNTINTKALLSQEQSQELKRIFIDPSLPLPSIKRENQGIFCNTNLQLYLVGLRFPHYGNKNWQPNFFQELQQRLTDEQQICFKDFFEIEKNKNKHPDKKIYQNLHLVRYMPYQINFQNFTSLLLDNNTAHNLIVYIFTLTDLWIEANIVYLNSITDPYYKFIELMTRYSIFRALIIQVQESLGFLFKSYESLYRDTIKDSIFSGSVLKPKYCFWRPALSKWFTKMQHLHKQNINVYLILLTQMREDKLKATIESLQQNNKSWALLKKNEICLKNSLEINGMTSQMKSTLYNNYSGDSLIQNFLYQDQTISESLIFEFVEYIIDLSINQETVHWCGHSQHKLGKAFHGFLNEFMPYNKKYYLNLQQNILNIVMDKHQKFQLLHLLMQDDVEFLETKNIKAVILRQLIQQTNQEQSLQIEQLQKDSQIILSQKAKSNSPIIKLSFKENDERLKYFNQKAKIFQSIQGEEKYFFEIPPILSLEEILSKSINTDDTSENGNDNEEEGYQYISDGEDSINDVQPETQQKKQNQQNTQEIIHQNISSLNQTQLKLQQDTLGFLQVSQNSTVQSNQLEKENDKTTDTNINTSFHQSHSIFKANSF